VPSGELQRRLLVLRLLRLLRLVVVVVVVMMALCGALVTVL
jgi:hypothetical protein